MPMFRTASHAKPDEVTVAIGGDGMTARVMPPHSSPKSDSGIHDLRLSTALHVAGALADRLGTQVCVVDLGDDVVLIDDPRLNGLLAS